MSRPLRVLWIGPWRADSLCAQSRGDFAEAMARFGCDMSTVVYGPDGSWSGSGFRTVHYLPPCRSLADKLANQARLVRLIARYTGDVVIFGERAAHLVPVARLLRRAGRKGWRIVVDVRTLPIPSAGGAARFWASLRLALAEADGWTAITDRLRAAVVERIGERTGRRTGGRPGRVRIPSCVWGSGVDRALCDTPVGDLDVGPDGPRTGGGLDLLYLGTVTEGRRLDVAVAAMRIVRQRRADCRLHVVGSGPAMDRLERLADSLHLAGTVDFQPPVPHCRTPQVIAASDAGILPLPDREAWNTSSPLKLFEYMAAGKMVIVSDIPAHRDLLAGRPFATFMSGFCQDAFAKAVLDLAALAPLQRRRLGDAARRFVRRSQTWDHRAAVVSEFLSSLVCRAAAGTASRSAA